MLLTRHCSQLRTARPSHRASERHRFPQKRNIVVHAQEDPKPDPSPEKDGQGGDPSAQKPLEGNGPNLQIAKEVIERLRYNVFGFDTFWVTSVDNYETDGVVFKGNVRGKDPAVAYTKIKERLEAELGDRYQLFLMEDRDEQPTAIVLPTESATDGGGMSKGSEIWLAVLFAILTAVTTLDANGLPLLDFLLEPTQVYISQQDILDALPGAATFWFLLGSHEVGHFMSASRLGLRTYLPFILPGSFGLLGSFGGVTRQRGFMPNREALLDFGVTGPLYGTAASLVAVLLGYILTANGAGDVAIETSSFGSSLFMGTLAQIFLGDELAAPTILVHPLLVGGWGGLLVNALSCIPTGELDGGRIALSIWGRRVAGLLSILTIAALSIASFSDGLAFYWVLLVLVLQRGPLLPCYEEIKAPANEFNRLAGLALLATPLLVLVPFPMELLQAIADLQDPTLF